MPNCRRWRKNATTIDNSEKYNSLAVSSRDEVHSRLEKQIFKYFGAQLKVGHNDGY